MGKKRVLPTTEVINKFNALGEAERAFVADYIKSQATVPTKPTTKKSGAQSAGSKSSTKPAGSSTIANTGGEKVNATGAFGGDDNG